MMVRDPDGAAVDAFTVHVLYREVDGSAWEGESVSVLVPVADPDPYSAAESTALDAFYREHPDAEIARSMLDVEPVTAGNVCRILRAINGPTVDDHADPLGSDADELGALAHLQRAVCRGRSGR